MLYMFHMHACIAYCITPGPAYAGVIVMTFRAFQESCSPVLIELTDMVHCVYSGYVHYTESGATILM